MNRADFAKRARELRPKLHHRTMRPVRCVRPVPDESAFVGYRMETEREITGVMHTGDAVCWDFGEHMVGHVTLKLSLAGTRQDSPVRLRLTFGETPDEIARSESEYGGWLSAAWLQTETITLETLPGEVTPDRRYAFRYLKLEVAAASVRFGVRVDEVSCDATTSAEPVKLPAMEGMDGKIAEVCLNTLRDCMQDFFEDGPKRDRRLWIGDLRLQALANHVTFRNLGLVRRCLYMIAAAQLPSGWLPAAVYDTDPPMDDEAVMVDYALLYIVTLRDLLRYYDEPDLAEELYPVCRQQAELAHERLQEDGTFRLLKGEVFFIDWNDRLQRDAAALGVYLYGLNALREIAEKLGRAEDIAQMDLWMDEAKKLARENYWDEGSARFISQGQISMASQIWMLLGGVPDTAGAERLIRSLMAAPPVLGACTPYLKHYQAEAMWRYGFREEALGMIRDYWGAMIGHGADTFWEVFIPDDPDASPYGGTLIHSRCHAWSCTPVLFLLASIRE